jgi:hypothetical protein
MSTTRVPPSTKEILKRQVEDAARQRAAAIAQRRADAAPPASNTAVVPAKSTAVAVPDNRTAQQQYLDEIAPAAIVGRLIKFSKDGTFITGDDDKAVDENAPFTVLADQTLIGWQKFHEGAPPEQHMGLLYSDFVMPPRESLGDMDESQWPAGLSGAPEDPWKHCIYVVLQSGETAELFTFATRTKTGRRAVGDLLKHYDRMRRTHPDELPVAKLRAGGFQHKDDRIGFVPTPLFAVVGRALRDSVAKPDTSVAAQLNDAILF